MNLRKFSPAEALDIMLKNRGRTSVSLIIPLLHANPDHHEDWDRINRSVHEAFMVLENISQPASVKIRVVLKSISSLISFNRNNKGIGIYISGDFVYLAYFPFSVEGSVTVSDSFQMKEFFRLNQFSGDTLLLTISCKRARLFQIQGQALWEIKDEHFPLMAEDGFEFDHPSRSTSYAGSAHVKSFEKDKSVVRKRKFREFIRKTDDVLNNYLAKGRDFIISGTATHISEFRSVSRHNTLFTSELVGGYDWFDANEYNSLIWPLIQKRMGERLIDILEKFNRRAGEGFTEQGMTQVWNAVLEGRVDILLLDDRFETNGFVQKAGAIAFISGKPTEGARDYFPLAVNELCQQAALQQARIVFLDKDLMPEGEKIAAICRY